MFGYNRARRLQLVLFPLGNLNAHLGLFPKYEAFVVPKSYSSSTNKTAIAGVKEDNPLPFTVSYLVKSCGISLDTAKSLSKHVRFENPKKPDSVLEFLSDNGLTDTHISKLIRSTPRLLLADTEKVLLPKLQFFKSVGISGSHLADVVSASGNLLGRSLTNHIIPTYNFFKKWLKNDDKVVRVLKNAAYINHCATLMSPKIVLLEKLGVPQSSIAYILTYSPRVLCRSAEKFDGVVKKVVEIGFDPMDVRFVKALVSGFGTDESWEHKLNVYRRWGWTEEEFHSAFRRTPTIMSLSEENITRKMDFFVTKMGSAPSTIATCPVLLCYSMEKRIIPRCSVIKTLLVEGLIKEQPTFSTLLGVSDKKFMDKYVIPHHEQVPQLLDIFQGEVKLSELGFKSEGLSEIKPF